MQTKKVYIDLKKGAPLYQLKRFWAAKGEHPIKVRYNKYLRFNGREYTVEKISKDYAYALLREKISGARKIGILKKFKVVRVV